MLAWVLFRAESFDTAMLIYQGMFGMNGLTVPSGLVSGVPALVSVLEGWGLQVANLQYLQGTPELMWLLGGSVICFLAPNAYQFMAQHHPALIPANIELRQGRIAWSSSLVWALVFAGLFAWSVLSLNRVSEFLYFQF